MPIREVIDVPMSHVVAITDVGFTVKIKKLFGWEDRQFLYLWFATIGGPLSREPLVIGQHTDMGTLLRFYSDVREGEEHRRQVEDMMTIAERIAEAVREKRQAARDLAEDNLSEEERRMLRRMFGE